MRKCIFHIFLLSVIFFAAAVLSGCEKKHQELIVYSGQGLLIYANNGELSTLARTRPDIESGVLAQWPGHGGWQVVRRNQFTEVTGPGGLWGNDDPAHDPVWSIGWDHRSLILMAWRAGA